MEGALRQVIFKFEQEVQAMNNGRSVGPFRKMLVTVLGQFGLLIRHKDLENLNLVATNDFDALLNGEPPLEDIFKQILRMEGLAYDKDSDYIWLPEEAKFELIYESNFIKVDSPLPIYLIVSKAVKAPEKNRQLVTQAIVEFGDDLLRLLSKYKVDLNYFT